MTRSTLERMNNKHGHHYQRDGSIHVCWMCGTAEHRNGIFWWAGRCSLIEPPCSTNPAGQREWYATAEEERGGKYAS